MTRGSQLLAGIALLGALPALLHAADLPFAVLVSADAEWRALKQVYPGAKMSTSPYGEYFFTTIGERRGLVFHGGWGKVSAAASTQYVIDHFQPARLINLGTCGGVEGRIERFSIVAVERVIIYDIHEAMGDSQEAIDWYSTALPLPAQLPPGVIRATMYSADRDLTPPGLREIDARYKPVVADWESGAIAWVAHRNHVPLLILRGVTDLVSLKQAEAQGNLELFQKNTLRVMRNLWTNLPHFLESLRQYSLFNLIF